MKIGIIGAMPEEVDLIKEEMEITDEVFRGGRRYYLGIFRGCQVVLVFSKCGKVAAATTVTVLIESFGVDFVIFTGVAGGADRQVRVGDIVIADQLVQHDMDVTALSGYEPFQVPLLNQSYFRTNAKYVQLAQESALAYLQSELQREIKSELLAEFGMEQPQVIVGTIASGDQFIAAKSRIQALTKMVENLKCVEMEGAAVAQVCFEYEIPCLVLRVISDNADDSAQIDYRKFVSKAASFMTGGIIRKLVAELPRANEKLH